MSPKSSFLVLVAGLAALWSFGGPRNPTPAEPPTALSSAHAHGNLTVFILRGPDVLASGNILTLGEALEKGLAVVHETGSVNLLEVENLSIDHELFLQSGDIVKGGKQDRIIADDMLVKAKSGRVPCPANCCEQSRWQPRGGEVATKFEKSTDFAVGNAIKIANASGQQGVVWDNVAKTQAALSQNLGKPVTANASPTSLQLALEDTDLRAKVAGYERSLGGLANAYPDAVGAVLAVNGQVIASDVYGSKELFRKAWPKLLKSAAVDAVAQQPAGEVAIADRSDAVAFLKGREEGNIASNGSSIGSANPDLLTYRAMSGNLTPEERSRSTNTDRGLVVEIPENEQVALSQLSEDLRNRISGARVNVNPNAPGQPAPQMPNFSGRSGATRAVSVHSGGANRNEPVNAFAELANNNLQPVQWQMGYRVDLPLQQTSVRVQPSATPGVVTFESRSGSQKNALIHRGQLKK